MFAVLSGIAISVVRKPPARFSPGIAFTARKLLQASIVLMGLGLSLGQVLSTGARSMPVLQGTLAAASYGVIVKLTRTLAIIPVYLGLAAVRSWCGKGGTERSVARRVSVRRVVPVFLVAFIAAVATNTIGLVPAIWHHGLSDLSTWMITAALAAIGLSTDVHRIRRAGPRSLALGAVLWVTVALTSLGLQALTGSC